MAALNRPEVWIPLTAVLVGGLALEGATPRSFRIAPASSPE